MTGRRSDARASEPAANENRPATSPATRPTKLLRGMLEEQRRTHTIWLTRLMHCGQPPGATGYDSATADASVAAARQGVADTTQALHRMEQAGWIRPEWKSSENKRRAKYYHLTPKGKDRLAEEQENWLRVSRGVAKVLRYA